MSVVASSSDRVTLAFPQPRARDARAMQMAVVQVAGDASAGSASVSHTFPSADEAVQLVTVSAVVTGVTSSNLLFQWFTGLDNGVTPGNDELYSQSVTAAGDAAYSASGVGGTWSLPQMIVPLSDAGTAPLVRVTCANPGAGAIVRLSLRYLTFQRNVFGFVPFGTQNVPITAS